MSGRDNDIPSSRSSQLWLAKVPHVVPRKGRIILLLIISVSSQVNSDTLKSKALRSYESVETTNKMQNCNRIYYSKVYWSLNMFRAAHRSSSGALNCICSLCFIYTCGDQPLSSLSGLRFPLSLDNGRSPHVYINQRLQIQFRAPDDERCAVRNMLSL
jgi:hypothetical protein